MDPNRHECVRRSSPKAMYLFRQRSLVAQICNLPYRRIAFSDASARASALVLSDALPIANRRYSRLPICATLNTYEAVNVNSLGCNPGCGRFGHLPAPKGSNAIVFSGSSIRPLRGRDPFANCYYPGFHPGLFTLQPSGLPIRVNSCSFVVPNFLRTPKKLLF